MTIDEKLGIVYLAIGSPAYDYYGGDRKGKNLYGNCLLALDGATGKLLWYYQFVHHDIWDYDPPAPPALITARGKPAVMQVTKMGLVFIFDRKTGSPLFPIQERAVPQSHVPGEATWPTQPIPSRPPPIALSSITREDLTTVSPESHRFCEELFNKAVHKGRYTPWELEPTLVYPGSLGGANWSGASFDATRGLAFVNANEIGAIGQLKRQPEGSPNRYQRVATEGAGPRGRFWDPNLWPCQKPPWGTLSAINVTNGEIVWKVPLGVTEALEKRGIHNTGAPNIGGSIATAGGIVFIAATNDERLRAFDSDTGKELWSSNLDASGFATPITYQTKSGRQVVVIAAGGGGFFSDNISDSLIAFRLPE
jgi:quinoprotein glucose dehydrogenase